jgi:hypothetical protein
MLCFSKGGKRSLKNILTTILIVISLLIFNVRTGVCQNTTAPVTLDEKAQKIKRVVQKIGVAGRLTLYLKNDEKLYGSVVSYDEESLQIAEIDLKQVLTIQYRNIKKVREDYGKRDPITGRRSNPSKGVKIGITVGLLFTAIAVPLIAIASMKD